MWGNNLESESVPLARRPFITTVRAGAHSTPIGEKCVLCVKCKRENDNEKKKKREAEKEKQCSEIYKLKNEVFELTENLEFYKTALEVRDREIGRLTDLLAEHGRHNVALAAECCYKEVETLSADLIALQKEKNECLREVTESRKEMHECKQRALDIFSDYTVLQDEMMDIKKAAIDVETDANTQLEQYRKLNNCFERQELNVEPVVEQSDDRPKAQGLYIANNDKLLLLNNFNERLHNKVHFLMSEIKRMQEKNYTCKEVIKQRLLKIIKQRDEEIEILNSDLLKRDERLEILQRELNGTNQSASTLQDERSTDNCPHVEYKCIEAAIERSQQQVEKAYAVLRLVRTKKDELKRKYENLQKEVSVKLATKDFEMNELDKRIAFMERELRETKEQRIPCENEIIMLREQNEMLNEHISTITEEKLQLIQQIEHLRICQQETDYNLCNINEKLREAESKLHMQNASPTQGLNSKGLLKIKNDLWNLRTEHIEVQNTNVELNQQLNEQAELLKKVQIEMQ